LALASPGRGRQPARRFRKRKRTPTLNELRGLQIANQQRHREVEKRKEEKKAAPAASADAESA
jgi:hypothetical protein